jgi:tetratricopeptide (TPR) repeat protein
VDIQTRPAGNAGSFSRVSTANPSWLEHNRQLVIRLSVILVIILLGILAGAIWVSNQAQKAQVAFGSAMDVYDAPIQQPGQQAIPNVKVYPSAAARARDANPLFQQVAGKYGWFKAGGNARYFAGLTAMDMGDNTLAETDLKKASDADGGLGALSKMALASLYLNTGRQGEAAELYRSIIEHPTLTVSASAARLALAASEETTNPQGAKVLYAQIKDSDKNSIAAQIATQKLSGGK